jgi:alpha-L-rhamnosidase
MTLAAAAQVVAASASHAEPGLPARYFRRELPVRAGLRRAVLQVTGLGIVEAWLNGHRVGDEVLAPGWTSYQHRLLVSSYDVTDLLVPGSNTVGAIVGEGWAVGRVGYSGNRNHWADRPALLLQLDLDYDDGTETLVTDASWRTSTGAVLEHGIYEGETFDARLEPVGWSSAAFDDSAWSPVEVLGPRHTAPLAMPPVRRVEDRRPEAVLRTPSGRTVVDFGQLLTGWVRIEVDGAAGTTVELRHCELLVDGEPCFETNRTAQATDRYTLRGGGPETWEPRFTFHGFRYVEVVGWPGDPTADALTAVVVHSDVERTGWFDSSHELLDRLHSNVVWSFRGNAVSIPSDCPQRDERMGWTGDLNAFASTAAFLYDVEDFLGSWLEDLEADTRELGVVPFVVPHLDEVPRAPTALWGDVAVNLPWTLYEEYGDVDLLAARFPSMVRFVDSVVPHLDEGGLWSRSFQFGDWLDPDAPPSAPFRAKAHPHLVATAYLCRSAGQVVAAAEVLGLDSLAHRALHSRVREAFRDEWVTPSGRLAEETVTGYSLALCFGLLDPSQVARAGRRLAELVAAADHCISTGFAGTPWVAHALTMGGQLETAYRLVLQTRCPSFLYPVTMGATTVWERWDAVLPDGQLNSTGMTSLNHYALGAVADWLHKVVGGIEAAAPGYSAVRIAPRPGGGLTHATCRKRTRHGDVEVAWRVEGSSLVLDVTLPPGTAGEVLLPFQGGEPLFVGPGTHRWLVDVPPPVTYGLDTPFHVLRGDAAVWSDVSAALQALLPRAAQLVEHITETYPDLRHALAALPRIPPGFETDLANILTDR